MPIVTLKELKAHLPAGKRLLGIDQGTKTLGLALATPDLGLATPLKTLKRTKFSQDVLLLAEICRAYDVAVFVIGLPLHMDGREGDRSQSVRHFGDNLLKAADIFGFEPVIMYFDERLSTHAATDLLINDLNMKRKKRKNVIDALAAAHILQGALDALRHGT